MYFYYVLCWADVAAGHILGEQGLFDFWRGLLEGPSMGMGLTWRLIHVSRLEGDYPGLTVYGCRSVGPFSVAMVDLRRSPIGLLIVSNSLLWPFMFMSRYLFSSTSMV